MKKIIAWLLVLALTAAISIGATLAYLMNTDEDVNVMTLGKVKIDQLEYERIEDETANADATVQEFHDNKPLYPAVTDSGFDYTPGASYVDWEQIGKDGYTSPIWDPTKINNELDKMVFVKNKGDYDAYVRSAFAFEAGNYKTLDEFQKMVHLNLNETDWTWEWVETPVEINGTPYFIATATYNKVLAPGALTEISLSQIALDKTATNADVEAFGDTYQVLVKSQGIQADGFGDPAFALEEGFGVIDAKNVPWTTDSAVKGIDLKTALHNLDGNTATPITANVGTITFGLNKDYANIVDNYTGTLVDVEQDVPVYAYYVKNGSTYDVYCLADDVIYAPANSTGLFQGMKNVTSIDTGNFDVSRAELAVFMFRECTKLPILDAADWDTSKITNMQGMFYKCNALTEITGISDWNVSNVTSLYAAFYNLHAMTELDLSGWDVRKVTNLNMAICRNNNLQSLDLSGWNIASACDATNMLVNNYKLESVNATGMKTAGITHSSYMFQNNYALKTITGHEGWTFPNLKNAVWMFENCYVLESLNAPKWDLSSLELATGMFSTNGILNAVTGSGNWNLSKVTDVQWMFQNDNALTYIDATNWDLSNCVNARSMFLNCYALETVEGSENWDTGNVENMYAMFCNNYKLKDLDVSTWNTSKVTTVSFMFGYCLALEELDVSDWNVSKVTDFSYFFKDDGNLHRLPIKELDVSDWNPVSAVKMDCMFYGCGQLTKLDLSGWNMPNLRNTNHMFADCEKLVEIDLTGWQTPSLFTMDAMFNNCEALLTVDMSSFDTSNVKEFSQMFEACYSLKEIKGLENWKTGNGASFCEMFSGCSSLKELNLSSFDTTGADESYKYHYENFNEYSEGYQDMFSGMTSLEKLVLGKGFCFDGEGKVTTAGYKMSLPRPAAVEGSDGKWYNAETGVGYLPGEIPEHTAATYVAVKPATP